VENWPSLRYQNPFSGASMIVQPDGRVPSLPVKVSENNICPRATPGHIPERKIMTEMIFHIFTLISLLPLSRKKIVHA
jgi:hypothetical protein